MGNDNRFFMQQINITINLNVPTAWEHLSQKQLRYFFTVLVLDLAIDEVKTYCFCRWAGLKVLHRYGSGFMCRKGRQEFVLQPSQVADAIRSLDWLAALPARPVRLERIGRRKARPADFQQVPFEVFIICDNLYQGYLSTRQETLLDQLAAHLYDTDALRPTAAERVSVFYWFAALKAMLASEFKHFFQPVGNAGGADGNLFEQNKSQYELLNEAVNAQIRALTKGDITKEKEVLAMDTWRALAELDAQAREYEELNRKYPSK